MAALQLRIRCRHPAGTATLSVPADGTMGDLRGLVATAAAIPAAELARASPFMVERHG